ncbi:ComF family protein [Pseudalkalibacillus caeni]|uniref:ComF family protein n=1 Tax=Exobacillus caeni TaxID=2574798 RepID=UPI001484DAAA
MSKEFRKGELCLDCIRWEDEPGWAGVLVKNRSVYQYNDFLKGILSRIKFRGDAVMVSPFMSPLKTLFKLEFPNDVIVVPIPLSSERLYERGFNQAKVLAELLDVQLKEILIRDSHEGKQSKKNRRERLAVINQSLFKCIDNVDLEEKNVLLVDDIYTTGVTIRNAAKELLNKGANKAYSLTVARG